MFSGGEGKVPSISGASILAKVTRDCQMIEADHKYPEMGYAGHKGYGSKKHQEMILKRGINELYRRTYKSF